MIAHMVCAFKEDYMIGARRVRRILLDMADALCEAKWESEAFLRSALVALDSMVMLPMLEQEVGIARARIALAFECNNDTVLADLLSSAC
jgi:hypothetical protein